MKAVIASVLLVAFSSSLILARQKGAKPAPSKNSNDVAARKEITQLEVLWASAIGSNDPKTVADLLAGSFTYSGSAQSDFDAMLLPMREKLSRSQYIDTVTNSGVTITLTPKEIKVSVDENGNAIAHIKLQVLGAPSAGPRDIRPGTPKIMPGNYEVTDTWTNTKQGWKAAHRSAVRLVGGSLVPLR